MEGSRIRIEPASGIAFPPKGDWQKRLSPASYRSTLEKKAADQSIRLMTLFSVSAMISILVILGASFTGIRAIYQANVIEIAEQQSVSITRALFGRESDLLSGGNAHDAQTLHLSDEDFELVDRRMHDYLRPFDIVKIKVFSKQKAIIYSTDPTIVGRVDHDNSRLESALGGKVDAELETKDKIVDLSEEARIDIDVVETYVPVTNAAGEIIGCAEIYMDVTHYRKRLASILGSSMTVIGLILVGVFGTLFLVMRHGTKRLHEYERKLHDMATTDVLTGTANRRFLLNRADEEFSRVQRERRCANRPESAGYILVDIDHFKRVNDIHGHQVGDTVLREVANRFSHCIRRYDTVGRYGGEEFLVVAGNSSFTEVKEIAERLWHEVRDRPFEVGNLSLDVTVSIGFSCVEESDVSIGDVIKRADDGLYRAKAAGRDQVFWLQVDGQDATRCTDETVCG